MYKELACDVWKELHERFSRVDRVRITELQLKFYPLKQNSSSVMQFFTEMLNMWEESEIYQPMPQFTCHVCCTCEAMNNARSQRDEDCVMRLLIGLNDENFAMVKSQILLINLLPSMNQAFPMVIEHERQNGLSLDNEEAHNRW